jgi:hypothetical protein
MLCCTAVVFFVFCFLFFSLPTPCSSDNSPSFLLFNYRDDWDDSDDGAQDSDALVASFKPFLDQLTEQW